MATVTFFTEDEPSTPVKKPAPVEKDTSIPASSEKKKIPSSVSVALCIGNAHYECSPLNNPINDATAVAELLERHGYDVELVCDASKKEMNSAIERFNRKIKEGARAVFFFAGHGEQGSSDGISYNFLIPIEGVAKDVNLQYDAVNLNKVQAGMQSKRPYLSIIIVDCCRAYSEMQRSTRARSGGLAAMEAPHAGSFIAFACAPGQLAGDGSGKHGVFTEAFLNHAEAEEDIDMMFRRVKTDVQNASESRQVPWTTHNLSAVGEGTVEHLLLPA